MHQFIPYAAIALLLSACVSEGPANRYFPLTSQKELFSASHWKILAAQTASELRGALPPGSQAIWLQDDDESLFSSGFNEFLADELVHHGIYVSRDHGARVIKVKVEVVQHRSGPPTDPLKFTFLGGVAGLGVWFERSAPLTMATDAIPPVAVAAGALLDAKRAYMPSATSTEVIVSTAIFEGGYQTGGKSDVFYVQTRNAGEYRPSGSRTISVVGF